MRSLPAIVQRYDIDGRRTSRIAKLRQRARIEDGEEVPAYLLGREQIHGRPKITRGNWRHQRKERWS